MAASLVFINNKKKSSIYLCVIKERPIKMIQYLKLHSSNNKKIFIRFINMKKINPSKSNGIFNSIKRMKNNNSILRKNSCLYRERTS